MSTRGSICIKLKDEDLDKDFHMKDVDGNDLTVIGHTHRSYPYMYVYCHHDSYIEKPGLGYLLPRKLQTYEEVRDFIMQGDRSSFDEPYTKRGEDHEDLSPNYLETVDGDIPEEYFYLFENDKWYVKTNAPFAEFKELEYIPEKIEITEKEADVIKHVFKRYLNIINTMKDILSDEVKKPKLINEINNINIKFHNA